MKSDKEKAYECAMQIVHGNVMPKDSPLPSVSEVASVIERFYSNLPPIERWHGRKKNGDWAILGYMTSDDAKEMMVKHDLIEVASDDGLCTLV